MNNRLVVLIRRRANDTHGSAFLITLRVKMQMAGPSGPVTVHRDSHEAVDDKKIDGTTLIK